ncbi:MAG: box helicase protein box helicase protein [Candidatus Kaiserbacteria bacterium]|nr:box helicase protein box helicase protein [Candidatus Kaiserbacteria bacterium]
MRIITFDIETANFFSDVNSNDPADLTLAIICIHDSETDSYSSYLESELPQLWPILERADLLVGYNSDHFDIPLLNKYYPGDLTRMKSIDIMKEMQMVTGRRYRLDAVAEGTLGKKKTAGKGGQSVIWWREGKINEVRDYCLKDVELTKKLFDYALEKGSLKYKELGKSHEVKLDISKWLAPKSSAMTFTLGF